MNVFTFFSRYTDIIFLTILLLQHGTHCAGTIGAIGGNSLGVTSVNNDPKKFKFHIGKGLKDSGSGFSSNVMSAVQSCIDNGASVVSMSLGGSGFSATTAQFYKKYSTSVLIIAAAGNGYSSSKHYPASYEGVMSVAAVDSAGNKAGFSQYNE